MWLCLHWRSYHETVRWSQHGKEEAITIFFLNFSFAIQSHLRCGLRVNLCVEILALAVAALTEPLQPKGIGARGREQ